MSKLVTGHIDCPDLDVVQAAAELLGWTVGTNLAVSYYNGPGEQCDIVVRPVGETDRYGNEVGRKYTIGFKKTAEGIQVYHDNAMNGAEVYSAESGKLDDTTERVVGKMKQAINRAVVERHLKQKGEKWRIEQRGNVQVVVVRRG